MTYSIDLRERAVRYVNEGGKVTEAARLFGIHRQTLHNWLRRGEELHPSPHGFRQRKLDMDALAADVSEHPDAYLRERAERFGVSHQSIWVALRRLNLRKKNAALYGDKSQ